MKRHEILLRHDIEALHEELLEATEKEWDANIRVIRVASNLRRSHVAFCKARMAHTSATSFVTYREQLANVAEVPRIAAEVHSPSLELIENSLTSHAPPIESESKTETLSS
jgi:hypothetical protein